MTRITEPVPALPLPLPLPLPDEALGVGEDHQ
jgi:hypothetical protein